MSNILTIKPEFINWLGIKELEYFDDILDNKVFEDEGVDLESFVAFYEKLIGMRSVVNVIPKAEGHVIINATEEDNSLFIALYISLRRLYDVEKLNSVL